MTSQPTPRLGYDWAPDARRPGRQVQRCRGCGAVLKAKHAEGCALRYPHLRWLLAALPIDRQGELLALRWSRWSSTSQVRLLALDPTTKATVAWFAEDRSSPHWAVLDVLAWGLVLHSLPLPALAGELARHFAADAPDGPAGPGYQWEQLVCCDPTGTPAGTAWVEICESCRTHRGLKHNHDCPNNPDRMRW